MTCTLCKLDRPKSECTLHYRAKSAKSCDRYKCKTCNALLWRIGGVLTGNDVLGAKFKEISPEQKQQFLRDNHTLMGTDLKAAIMEVCEYVETSTMAYSALGTGNWIDETDLRKKYESKPGVPENIMKNAKSFDCPISGRTLFEDVVYQTQSKAENTESIKRKLEISTESKRRGAKAKAAPVEKAKQELPEDGGGVGRPLSDKHLEQLQKTNAELERNSKKLDQYLKVCEVADIKDGIPPSLIAKGKTCSAETKVHSSAVALIIEEKNCQSFQELTATGKVTKSNLKEVLKKFSAAVKAASEEAGKKVTFKEDGTFEIVAAA